jgi:phosphatidylinositol alpha-1,6-mannosyltransferase
MAIETDRLAPMSRVMIVTNDFPPRQGGIETFVATIAGGLPADQVVVYTSRTRGQERYDAGQPYPVLRDPTSMLVPSPVVRHRVVEAFRTTGCDRVLFGAAAPLGLLAAPLRAAGAQRIVGITHGHELWWARVPGARRLLRRIGTHCDALTYLGEYTHRAIAGALTAAGGDRMVRMPPGVDTTVFRPAAGGGDVLGERTRLRERWGIDPQAPVVLCVGRLTPRKGQDTLVAAWPEVLAAVPDARLVITGPGDDSGLRSAAARLGVANRIVFTGGVPHEQTPAIFAAADVFASPCRDRHAGLEVEGLGIVFLEASACGLPVIVGRSGGAVDTVLDGRTGMVVDPTDVRAVAAAAVELLTHPELAAAMGRAGREWVEQDWTWRQVHETVARLLEL